MKLFRRGTQKKKQTPAGDQSLLVDASPGPKDNT